jgi:aryl-alcohol dehydrogenase-like predicted oxidoreductase
MCYKKRTTMEYVFLGRTGLKSAALGLGCMTLGHGVDEATGFGMLDRYTEVGGNLFDVADNYGVAEEVVGRWLQARGLRSQRILCTKVRFPVGDGPNDVGLTRKHILDGVENSLRRLQTDYIDLYQAHCWDFVTPIEETLRVFDDLVVSGKVRYIGASNFSGWQITRALAASEVHHWTRFATLQSQYSLLCRSPEWEILPACADGGVTVTAWSPLAAGWLSGKYQKDALPPKGSRLADAAETEEEWQNVLRVGVNATIPHPRKLKEEEVYQKAISEVESDRRWRILDAVGEVAKAHDKTHSQVALAWILARPVKIIPIIGVSRVEQLEDNLSSLEVKLGKEEIDWLNKVSDPGAPYPIDFFNQYGIPWR